MSPGLVRGTSPCRRSRRPTCSAWGATRRWKSATSRRCQSLEKKFDKACLKSSTSGSGEAPWKEGPRSHLTVSTSHEFAKLTGVGIAYRDLVPCFKNVSHLICQKFRPKVLGPPDASCLWKKINSQRGSYSFGPVVSQLPTELGKEKMPTVTRWKKFAATEF